MQGKQRKEPKGTTQRNKVKTCKDDCKETQSNKHNRKTCGNKEGRNSTPIHSSYKRHYILYFKKYL